jgi:hypothetical protein
MNGRAGIGFVAAGVIALSALGGCGGTSAPKKADPAADLQAAQDALIKAGDLPDFTVKPAKTKSASEQASDREATRAIGTCMHVSSTLLDDSKKIAGEQSASTPNFDHGSEEISASISIDPTKQTVDDGYALLQRSDFDRCFAAALGKLVQGLEKSSPLPADVTVGKVAVSHGNVAVGDRGNWHEFSIPFSGPTRSISMYLDMYVVQRGRAAVTLTVFNIGSRDQERAKTLLQTMVYRLGHEVS